MTNSTSHNKINVTGVGTARADLINQSQQATGIVPSLPPSTSGAPLLPSAAPIIVSPAQEKQQENSSANQVPSPEEETNRTNLTTEAKEEICDNGIDDYGDSLVDINDLGNCITQAQEKPNEKSASDDDVPTPNPTHNPPVGPFFIPHQ